MDTTTKPKRPMTEWTKFCKAYYDQNKAKFNNSYKDMLKSSELKEAYTKSKSTPVSGGMMKGRKKQ